MSESKKTKKPLNTDGVIRPKKTKKNANEIANSIPEPSVVIKADDNKVDFVEEVKTEESEVIDPATGENNGEFAAPDFKEDSEEEVEAPESDLEILNDGDASESIDELEAITAPLNGQIDDILAELEQEEADSDDSEVESEASEALEEETNIEETEEGEKAEEPKKEEKTKKSILAKPGKGRGFRIFSRILTVGTVAALAYLTFLISQANILPFQYFSAVVGVVVLYSAFMLFKSIRHKTHIPVLVILSLINIIMLAGSLFAIFKLNDTLSFLKNNLGVKDTETTVYNVVVNKDSEYTSLSSIKDKVVHVERDLMISTEDISNAVREQANASVAFEDNAQKIAQDVMTDQLLVTMYNTGTYDQIVEDLEGFKSVTRVIGKIEVTTKTDRGNAVSDITTTPFLIYLSGIDTRSGQMPTRSLSDVNIMVAVNPAERRILMVSTPRDYHVHISGTAEGALPDKLTHAGSRGGVQLSMATLQDLYGVEFNYYARVNFNSVVRLVDAIGGLTLYSDVDYSFTTWTNSACTIVPGNNTVGGECALAFARERKAYKTGDRHRGENQEQVIEKVIDKISSSSTLIAKYSDILASLDGTFETTMTMDDISALVKMNLNDMSKWKVESYNVDGTTGMDYTYSYPNQKLSVMHPNLETVETAKKKLAEVLGK